MKLTYSHFTLVLLGSILSFSSCKKEQTTDEEPYSSITNLSTIVVSNSNVYYCEPVKTLSLEDGYLMLANVHYDNGDIGIQYNKLDMNQEVVWSKTYSDGGYQYKGTDLIQVNNNFYILLNFELSIGGSTKIKILHTDINGNLLKEKDIPEETTSLSIVATSLTYEEDDIIYGPTLVVVGGTNNVDISKPGYTNNIFQEDIEDIYAVRLSLDLDEHFFWEATYGFVHEDRGQKVFNLADGFVLGGTSRNRERSSDYITGIVLVKYRKESGNIINTQQFNVPDLDLEWLNMIHNTTEQRFYIFTYSQNNPSTIYKFTVDEDFIEVENMQTINLGLTGMIHHRSIDLLTNGLFLATVEKPSDEDTQNIEWITFKTDGSVENRYSFNDLEQKYIESVGRLSEANSEILSTDRLLFPITYQNNRNIGTYQLDLNFPIQN
ncbi:MAG: hypothetical protein MK212_18365 [Saprospiraceae bacterium]|nr:hypothetical protein [Saprospiraceae bacterium]